MNRIAFAFGDLLIYWNSVVLAWAILTGVVLFWATYIRRSEHVAGAAILCPLAIVVSFWFARLFHWYFRAESYSGFFSAMTDFTGSGYALIGAFVGCSLSAAVLSLLGILKELPLTMDCMSIGGSAAIAVGRLSCFYTAENRGDILSGFTELPLVYPVVNVTSGILEYRFATFVFQSMVTAVIFVGLLMLFLRSSRCHDGDISLLFLMLYAATQIVLDSTRYDALRLRSNGFISVVQVFCALAMVGALVFFFVRMCRNRGWKGYYLLLWIFAAAGIGGAGYMEYHVQRHGDQALFAYGIMSCCLTWVVLIGLALWRMSSDQGILQKRYRGKFNRQHRRQNRINPFAGDHKDEK